jgi:hypothetical protein
MASTDLLLVRHHHRLALEAKVWPSVRDWTIGQMLAYLTGVRRYAVEWTANSSTALAKAQRAPPPAVTSSAFVQSRRSTRDGVKKAVGELYPNGIPVGLRAADRNRAINDYLKASGRWPASESSIKRALEEIRAALAK